MKNQKSIQPHHDAIEFAQVSDITAEGAFDDAIKGVDYVVHVASPLPPSARSEVSDMVDITPE